MRSRQPSRRRSRRTGFGRGLAYVVIGVLLTVMTLAINDAAFARWVVERLGPVPADSRPSDASSTAGLNHRSDVAVCRRIARIARRYSGGQLTDRDYMRAMRRAIAGAEPDGDVARLATASLAAFEAGDASAGARARDGLANACASAAA